MSFDRLGVSGREEEGGEGRGERGRGGGEKERDIERWGEKEGGRGEGAD